MMFVAYSVHFWQQGHYTLAALAPLVRQLLGSLAVMHVGGDDDTATLAPSTRAASCVTPGGRTLRSSGRSGDT